jgi:hypothetical protein
MDLITGKIPIPFLASIKNHRSIEVPGLLNPKERK